MYLLSPVVLFNFDFEIYLYGHVWFSAHAYAILEVILQGVRRLEPEERSLVGVEFSHQY